MPVTGEILATYRHPRRVLRRQLAGGIREERALVYLMLSCTLVFVAQWPRLSREAALSEEVPFEALFGAALLGWVFFMPLMFYLLAALSHLVARMMGGKGTWFSARLALFWTLLAVSPLWLLHGMVAGFLGQGAALYAVGLLLICAFGVLWMATLIEAEGESAGRGLPSDLKEQA